MAAKKRAQKKATHDLQFSLPLDEEKIKAIQQCLKKGRLTIKVSSIGSLKVGRGLNGYTYD